MIDIENALRRLTMRVNATVSRAVISIVNDGLKTQRLQLTIMKDEVEDDVEHFQPYGLSFNPPAGAEGIALAIGGMRSHTVTICAQSPGERPTGAKPRTGGLYTSGKWRVFVDETGTVFVGSDTATHPIPLGDVLKSWLESHTHPTSMGPSGTPIQAATLFQILSKHKVAP